METSTKKSLSAGFTRVSQICLLSFLFILTAVKQAVAQSGEPSLDNLKTNTEAASKELERIRHDEIMSYVYMSLGFAVVIAIAWSTTLMARKRNKREMEEKQRFILKQQEMRKHHGGLHKAKR